MMMMLMGGLCCRAARGVMLLLLLVAFGVTPPVHPAALTPHLAGTSSTNTATAAVASHDDRARLPLSPVRSSGGHHTSAAAGTGTPTTSIWGVKDGRKSQTNKSKVSTAFQCWCRGLCHRLG